METNKQIAKLISSISYPLSEKAQDKLASIISAVELKKGDVFLKEGDVCDKIGFVYKGMIRQFYRKNNKELTEYFAYENRFFGCMESCFRQTPSPLTAEALEAAIIYGIPREKLLKLSRNDHELDMLYHWMLENSLIASQRKVDSLRFETATERYNRLMKDDPEIIKRAPLSHIASYLLMTPETLSRVRANVI